MPKRRVPKQVLRKPTPQESAYIDSRTVTFEFEAAEALADRDWQRLENVFLDYGVFLERHPSALL